MIGKYIEKREREREKMQDAVMKWDKKMAVTAGATPVSNYQ